MRLGSSKGCWGQGLIQTVWPKVHPPCSNSLPSRIWNHNPTWNELRLSLLPETKIKIFLIFLYKKKKKKGRIESRICSPGSMLSACSAGNPGLIPGSGRSWGEGNGNPLQYSCLENSMDRGARWAIVHGVTRSWTRLSNFHSFTCSPELFSELNSEGRVLGTTKKNAFLKM